MNTTNDSAANITANDAVAEKSTPTERGKRLKILRNMSGLTIQELANKYGIGASTIKYWECARSEGLSSKGAKKMIDAMLQEGVYCTFMWLMHGVGIHPQILDVHTGNAQKQIKAMSSTYDEELAIAKEMEMFLKNSPEAVSLVIFDDAMEPLYGVGNTVGGVRLYDRNIEKAVGKDCIIETRDKEILCRRLNRGNDLNSFTLSSINSQTTVYPPNLYDMKIISVAPISRIWKRVGI